MATIAEAVTPAVAELKEQGATVEGDDKNSVAAAAIVALDIAADAIAVDKARMIVMCFEDNGDIEVYGVDDAAAERVKAALTGDGVNAGTVAVADLEATFNAAVETDVHGERESIPPPAGE